MTFVTCQFFLILTWFNTQVATGATDSTVSLWDILTGENVNTFGNCHDDVEITAMAFDGEGILYNILYTVWTYIWAWTWHICIFMSKLQCMMEWITHAWWLILSTNGTTLRSWTTRVDQCGRTSAAHINFTDCVVVDGRSASWGQYYLSDINNHSVRVQHMYYIADRGFSTSYWGGRPTLVPTNDTFRTYTINAFTRTTLLGPLSAGACRLTAYSMWLAGWPRRWKKIL